MTTDGAGDSVFLASNPRHVFLASGMALQEPAGRRQHLILIENFAADAVTVFIEALRAWPDSPFTSITRVEVDYRSRLRAGGFREKRALIRGLRRKARRVMREAVETIRPDRVYASCDGEYESQYALYRAKQTRADCRGIYLEDGTGAYALSFKHGHAERRGLAVLKHLRRKMTWGWWFRRAEVPGTSPWIDESYVAYPDLALPQIKTRPVHRLPREVFRTEAFRKLAELVGHAHGVDIGSLSGAIAMVALCRERLTHHMVGYVPMVRDLVERLAAEGRVIVKYHPRETAGDYFGFASLDDVDILPASVPFELISFLLPEPAPAMVGDVSTALLAVRWLRPDVRVVALRIVTDPSHAAFGYMEDVFPKLDIPVVGSPDEVVAYCTRRPAASASTG